MEVIQSGKDDIANQLCLGGADISFVDPSTFTTVLHVAAKSNAVKTTQFLLGR